MLNGLSHAYTFSRKFVLRHHFLRRVSSCEENNIYYIFNLVYLALICTFSHFCLLSHAGAHFSHKKTFYVPAHRARGGGLQVRRAHHPARRQRTRVSELPGAARQSQQANECDVGHDVVMCWVKFVFLYKNCVLKYLDYAPLDPEPLSHFDQKYFLIFFGCDLR